jgi:hypothetical protein
MQETLTAIDTSQQWSAINEQWSAEEQHVLLPAFDCDSDYSENVVDDISLLDNCGDPFEISGSESFLSGDGNIFASVLLNSFRDTESNTDINASISQTSDLESEWILRELESHLSPSAAIFVIQQHQHCSAVEQHSSSLTTIDAIDQSLTNDQHGKHKLLAATYNITQLSATGQQPPLASGQQSAIYAYDALQQPLVAEQQPTLTTVIARQKPSPTEDLLPSLTTVDTVQQPLSNKDQQPT